MIKISHQTAIVPLGQYWCQDPFFVPNLHGIGCIGNSVALNLPKNGNFPHFVFENCFQTSFADKLSMDFVVSPFDCFVISWVMDFIVLASRDFIWIGWVDGFCRWSACKVVIFFCFHRGCTWGFQLRTWFYRLLLVIFQGLSPINWGSFQWNCLVGQILSWARYVSW